MSGSPKGKGTIVLVVSSSVTRSRSRASNGDAGDDLSMAWRLDAIVVGIGRAAMANGVDLLVPFDESVGPLLGQIAAEYVAPRFAESTDLVHLAERVHAQESAITFYRVGSSSKWARKSRPPPWLRLLSTLSVASAEILPLRELLRTQRPLGVVTIGRGPSVETILREVQSLELPIYAFESMGTIGATSLSKRRASKRPPSASDPLLENGDTNQIRRPTDGRINAIAIEAMLEEEIRPRRSELRFYRPHLGDDFDRSDEPISPPLDFRRYPPYLLCAEIVVSRLLADQGHRR